MTILYICPEIIELIMSYGGLGHAISALRVNRSFYESSIKIIDSFINSIGSEKRHFRLLHNPVDGRPLVLVYNKFSSYNNKDVCIVGCELCDLKSVVSLMDNGLEIMPFIKKYNEYVVFGTKRIMKCRQSVIDEVNDVESFNIKYSTYIRSDKIYAAITDSIIVVRLNNKNYIKNNGLCVNGVSLYIGHIIDRYYGVTSNHMDIESSKYICDGILHDFTILGKTK